MKNKIFLIVCIITFAIVGFIGGSIYTKNKILKSSFNDVDNKIRYSLDGIYITDIRAGGSGGGTTTSHIDTMTFYSNGSVSISSILIEDINYIGTSVSKGTSKSGTYTLSNESKTILINTADYSITFTFSDDYKTISRDGIEYRLINGSLEDNIPKSTIDLDRNTGFSGKYETEKIENYEEKYESDRIPNSYTYKGKQMAKRISKTYYDFNEDGTFTERNEDVLYFSDGTTQDMSSGGISKGIYGYRETEKVIVIYDSLANATKEYNLSDDLATITDNRGNTYHIIE